VSASAHHILLLIFVFPDAGMIVDLQTIVTKMALAHNRYR
jgi:hypothetical protein